MGSGWVEFSTRRMVLLGEWYLILVFAPTKITLCHSAEEVALDTLEVIKKRFTFSACLCAEKTHNTSHLS